MPGFDNIGYSSGGVRELPAGGNRSKGTAFLRQQQALHPFLPAIGRQGEGYMCLALSDFLVILHSQKIQHL